MELPVLVSPQPTGFRASTGGPLDLAADGPTPDAAVGALRDLVLARLRSGQMRTLAVTDAVGIIDAARRVGESPLFEDWAREVEEYRRQNNTVPDAG